MRRNEAQARTFRLRLRSTRPSEEAAMQPFRDPLVLLLLATAGATAFFFVYMTA